MFITKKIKSMNNKKPKTMSIHIYLYYILKFCNKFYKSLFSPCH